MFKPPRSIYRIDCARRKTSPEKSMSASALALRGCCVGALSTSSHRRRSLTRSRHTGRVARGKSSGAAPTTARSRTLTVKAAQQDDEFAVFRFTLGIPGFDDEDIPRVIGFLGASLLVVNHLASSNPSDAQVRPPCLQLSFFFSCHHSMLPFRRVGSAP